MSQSTNDAYPTALKVAILRQNDRLLPELERLARALRRKGDAFLRIVKMVDAPKGYAKSCAAHLAKLTGTPIVPASDMIAATSDLQAFVIYSSALRSASAKLVKIASDLILLSPGPRAGLFEIQLAFRVTANDLGVALSVQHGQLQLNAYEPLAGLAILKSQKLLTNTVG